MSPTEIAAPEGPFDREAALADLLAFADAVRLSAALTDLLGERFRLVDDGGEVVLGDGGTWPAHRTPVPGELEPLGYLETPHAGGAAAGAADLLAELLAGARRYRMTAELHLHTVREDFRVLTEKHTALQHSEARLRELAAQLEARVAEQVNTIQSAQRRLYQAEKLASVGQLAAGVAHEINNPIGFIRSNLRTAQGYVGQLRDFGAALKRGEDGARVWAGGDLDFVVTDSADILAECLQGADRIARIVADLKGFARVDGQGEEPVDVNTVLRGVGTVGGLPLRDRVDLEYDLAAQLPPVTCDPARLGQAFLNLLQNAAQAMEQRGTVRFATEAREGGVWVTVSDTGRGIPADVLPKVFDPFFTTHDVGDGTGLGLTVCHDTVQAYGGRIEVESEPGRGTTFRVFLPGG
jgi:two-component system NtrC family sensor kinase